MGVNLAALLRCSRRSAPRAVRARRGPRARLALRPPPPRSASWSAASSGSTCAGREARRRRLAAPRDPLRRAADARLPAGPLPLRGPRVAKKLPTGIAPPLMEETAFRREPGMRSPGVILLVGIVISVSLLAVARPRARPRAASTIRQARRPPPLAIVAQHPSPDRRHRVEVTEKGTVRLDGRTVGGGGRLVGAVAWRRDSRAIAYLAWAGAACSSWCSPTSPTRVSRWSGSCRPSPRVACPRSSGSRPSAWASGRDRSSPGSS